MKLRPLLLTAAAVTLYASPSGASLIFGDNFNAPDTGNLDLSEQSGRRSGSNTQIQVRSSRIQHGITDNQLNFLSVGSGRIRFHDDLDNDNTTAETWHSFATGAESVSILAAGGLRLEFDWNAGNDTSMNWVSANIGFQGQSAGEPLTRVNNPETDIGMLFRFNGDTELFDNGTNLGAQGSFTPTIGTRHVTLDYLFDSFADGTGVSMVASVDGTEVFNGSGFTFDNNGGELYLELGTLENTLIDNLAISTVPEPSGLLFAGLGGIALITRRRR